MLLLFIAVAFYVLVAPDSRTAGVRAGAAGAVGAAARSGAGSIRSDLAGGRAARSSSRGGRSPQSGTSRGGGRSGSTGGRSARSARGASAKPASPTGGSTPTVAPDRTVGQMLRSALVAGLAAVRSGWVNGRAGARRGFPPAVRRHLPGPLGIRPVADPVSAGPGTPQSSQPPTAPPTAGTTPIKEKPMTATTTAQTISTEAGLRTVAQAIVAATAELAALIEAASAARTMADSLKFDPGEEVKTAISALADTAPDPDALSAFAESATAFAEAVETQVSHLTGD